METKTFLGLPLITSVNLGGLFRNWLSIILFTGLSYFLFSIIFGLFNGDIWLYIQSENRQYVVQFILLILGVISGHFIRVLLTNLGSKFFIYKPYDYIFYVIGFILTFLVLNEIWGL